MYGSNWAYSDCDEWHPNNRSVVLTFQWFGKVEAVSGGVSASYGGFHYWTWYPNVTPLKYVYYQGHKIPSAYMYYVQELHFWPKASKWKGYFGGCEHYLDDNF
jgi:hypothetical protein